jgi:hypothetical protein
VRVAECPGPERPGFFRPVRDDRPRSLVFVVSKAIGERVFMVGRLESFRRLGKEAESTCSTEPRSTDEILASVRS